MEMQGSNPEVSMQLTQTVYLVKLLLRMKRFKFLWAIPVIISVFSNHFVFTIIDNWLGNYGRTLTKIDATNFFWNSVIMINVVISKLHIPFVILMEIIEKVDQFVLRYTMNLCSSTEHCSQKLFKSLYGRSNTSKYTTFVDYGEDTDIPAITCQIAFGADLQCPYFGHLVASSKNEKLYKAQHTFGSAEFFSLTSYSDRTRAAKAHDASNSMCAKQDNIDIVLSYTAMIQAILLTCTVCFYFLVSTISCIVDLKKNGFLKIMFRKGLLVRSYWIAVWSVTSVEILLIAALLSISLVMQCSNFYAATSMLAVFSATLFQLFGIASVAFLLTVVLKKYFHMGLIMVLIAICTSGLSIILLLLLNFVDIVKIALLFMLPLGHLGEFTRAHLLTIILPDSVTLYHNLILAMTLLFPISMVALTLYLDYILSAGNGCSLDMNYIFDNKFWTTTPGADTEPTKDPLADATLPEMANVEPVGEGLHPIVRVSHLVKHYTRLSCLSREKQITAVALNDVSAHIYETQITAIIGHNGSGKTTLLNIMNGTDSPTSGEVSVDGLPVSDPITRMKLHRIVGVCPQENSLSNALTVMQTLEMALISCNRSLEDSAHEVENLLNALRMSDSRDSAVNKLSGGTKRKLCTAVALIGDSKVLFLDEPTSGVDPVSRRRVWKLLQEYKQKCSIILSTQSMDEADTLADRKIFLSGGAVICAGSSLFLKSAFDCGFDFNVTLKSPTFAPLLIRQIQEEFKSVKVRNHFRTNVDFHISAAEINQLPALAQSLERRGAWISAFGLLQTSLYDIFMRLRDLQPTDVEGLFKEGRIGLVSDEEVEDAEANARMSSRLSESFSNKEKKNAPSVFRTFRSIIRINLIRVVRSRVKLGSRIVAPLVLLLVLLVMAVIEKLGNNANLDLHRNLTNFGDGFKRGVCLYQAGKTTVDRAECASIFQNASAAHEENYLALAITHGRDLSEFLQDPENIDQIKHVCHSPGEQLIECPIVYTNEWKKTVRNRERFVSVGSFSTLERFNTSLSASVTIGGYYKLAKYFLAQHKPVNKLEAGDYKFTAKSVYNFRSAFIPLYGIFVQLVIISIVPSTFLDDLIEDKETKVRTQLSSMGMGLVNYWITMYFVHWMQYAAIYLISVILVVSINSNGYASAFYLAGIVLPTLTLGLSNNQFTVYILSSLLNKSKPIVPVTYFFLSIFLVIIILTVQLDNIAGVVLIALVPPITSIALTFYGTKAIFYTLSFFKEEGSSFAFENMKQIFFFQPHILVSFVAIFIHAIILPSILLLLERRLLLAKLILALGRNVEDIKPERQKDAGVTEEIQRIDDAARNPDNLMESRHLRMAFQHGVNVIRDVTFATSPGEILGLLGPNGAGKSTTMAIIVGDLRATGGRCEVLCGERWLSSGLAARRGYIGYCPQYNPQYANVTTREHLEFYACILGVAPTDAKNEINILLESLELDKHEEKMSSELSYGFRRRLSLAAALLGDPCLLVIDEASTGVDPEGKRILWRSIRALASKNRCIIISTHSMEEAEALCSRVCVMNSGSLVGLGSVQQLKSRYGQSSTLEVLIDTERNEPVENIDLKRATIVDAVSKKFLNSSVVEEFTNRVTFSIPLSSIGRLSHALAWLAEIKQQSHIQYFSFYQMSLDQVFTRMITLHNRWMFEGCEDSELSSESDPADTTEV